MKKRVLYITLIIFLSIFCIIAYTKDSNSKNEYMNEIKYDKIIVNELSDIYKKRKGLYAFSKLNIDLTSLNINERKKVFINLLLPSIKVVQQQVLYDRKNLEKLKNKKNLTINEKEYLTTLFNRYGVKYGEYNKLSERLIIYPTSLILTQGAIESAWGTSRFFKEGDNIFGIWAFNKTIPCIKADKKRNNYTACVRKFNTLKDSISFLSMMMSTNKNYNLIRKYINEEKNPYQIADGLIYYSEERKTYVEKVKSVLKDNEFTKYDKVIPYIIK